MKQSIMNLDARYCTCDIWQDGSEWAACFESRILSYHDTKEQAQDAARAHYNDNEGKA